MKEALQLLQETKYRFKALLVNRELLYFESYCKALDDMSNELLDVIEVVRTFGNAADEVNND